MSAHERRSTTYSALARVVEQAGPTCIRRDRLPPALQEDFDTLRRAGMLVHAGYDIGVIGCEWLETDDGQAAVAEASRADDALA